MTVETLNIVSIDSAFSDPNGAITDIDEPVASADGNSYGTTTENDTADFGLTNPALIGDADTVNSVTITIRAQKGGTAGNERWQVDLLIGGVVQGSQQSTGNLTTSFANYTGINDAGWNSDWTQAQLNGMQIRLTAIQAGMGGTQVTDLDCIDVDVDFTEAAAAFTPDADAFAFYENGTESGAALMYSEGEAKDVMRNHTVTADKPFHLRWRVQETTGGAGATTDDYGLRYRKNGGAWTAVTASSSNVQAAAGGLTDGDATTDRLSAGTGSFVAGEQEEVNGVVEDSQLTASNYTNHVFSLTLVEADLASGDVLEFQLTLNAGTPGMTNTVTPRLQVTDGAVMRDNLTGFNATADSTIIVTKPTSVVEGDLMVVVLELDGQSAGTIDVLAGWEEIEQNTAQVLLAGTFWKIAGPSEPSIYTFTTTGITANDDDCWACARFDGHDPTTPIDVSGQANGSSTAPQSPDITPTGTNRVILSMVAFDGNDFTQNIAPPTGSLTYLKGGERWNGSGGSAGCFWGFSVKPTAAAAGTATWASGTSDGWIAFGIAIAPEAAAVGNAPLFMHHFKQMANN